MGMFQRKVSFYKLSLEKDFFIDNHKRARSTTLSNAEMEEQFTFIYSEKMSDISNGRKAMEIETYNSRYVVEVIDYSNHRAFLKIGQQNSANTVALRDKNTLETESVPMRASQLLELFTFCLLDFEAGIVSYIGINGAPRITALKNMFYNTLYKERNIHAVFSAILTDDILEKLTKKSVISKVSVTVAVPSDEVLSESMGLSAESFDALRNVKSRTATYNITCQRNKNIVASSGKLAQLIADLKSKFGESITAMSARAKDHNEKSENYDLLQYYFTKTVSLGDADSTTLDEHDFRQALTTAYETNKDDLLGYCRA